MGLGVSRRSRAFIVLACGFASGCGGSGSDPALNPHPDIPVRPVDPRTAGASRSPSGGGAASTKDGLQRGSSEPARAQVRRVPDALGDGGAGGEEPQPE